MDRIYGPRKRSIYAELPSTVVEIGPGAGANLRYYAPYTRVIAIEPNPAMHTYLKAKAKRYNIDLEIRAVKGEQIDLADNSVAVVIGTLVLCTVAHPEKVLSEIHRILKPGGRYIYIEHVSDIPGTAVHFIQKKIHGVWARLFDGCRLTRHTHLAIQKAGFSHVQMDCFTMKSRWLPFAPHIFGSAIK
jgi:SAM-dependent methyltransferase